jgi:hypothetical protein
MHNLTCQGATFCNTLQNTKFKLKNHETIDYFKTIRASPHDELTMHTTSLSQYWLFTSCCQPFARNISVSFSYFFCLGKDFFLLFPPTPSEQCWVFCANYNLHLECFCYAPFCTSDDLVPVAINPLLGVRVPAGTTFLFNPLEPGLFVPGLFIEKFKVFIPEGGGSGQASDQQGGDRLKPPIGKTYS